VKFELEVHAHLSSFSSTDQLGRSSGGQCHTLRMRRIFVLHASFL
jgi:hypothetical protein